MSATTAKKLVILGSTGSIGCSALKVARQLPERVEVIALAANASISQLAEQAQEFQPAHVAIYREQLAEELRALLPTNCSLHTAEEGLCELATLPEADMVLISIVGTAGLLPALAAIRAGKDLAIASKEILVMAGELIMAEAKKHRVRIFPVDSEHNAIFQCLQGHNGDTRQISRIILTASGGPFRNTPKEQLEHVSLQQALQHPTWKMGQKITIDSATMFNKGLEMLEAMWLFELDMRQIDVIVHPQSIVHSMVEYVDGSVLAQLSNSDMCFPIQYAICWPDRVQNNLPQLDFAKLASLHFEAPRHDSFRALELARQAGIAGGASGAIYNAANEEAVAAFVEGRCGFVDITRCCEHTMQQLGLLPAHDLEQILHADRQARECAQAFIATLQPIAP